MKLNNYAEASDFVRRPGKMSYAVLINGRAACPTESNKG
jgi:hypothetical protein